LFLTALMAVLSTEAQEKQRIAVIPFNPVNIPKDEAEVIYKDFEAFLAATDAYVMIDREEIILLLGEGESSLFNCTSESCALDIAKSVAADQVIRGSLSRPSSEYVLKIQLVDVSNESILFLEEVSEQFLSGMRDAIELLAYKIAGLVITRYGATEIARQFTELFVETIPSRADIYINGIKRGISPDLIPRIPVGLITLSARYGNFYGEQTLEVTPNTQQVQIECREAYGTLQIRTDYDLDVYFNGRWLGKVSSGPFNSLPVGIHNLELKNQGLYWRDEVVLQSNQQTVVEAQPKEYGSIEYGIPDGAVAEITGELFREVVTGYGIQQVPVGSYSIVVTGKNYEPFEQVSISVPKNAAVTFQPELTYTEDYEYQLFLEQIDEAERSIQYGYRPTSGDVQELRELKQAISQSKHSFPNLLERIELLIERTETLFGFSFLTEPDKAEGIAEKQERLNNLLTHKQGLELEIENRNVVRKRRAVGGWVFLGLGLTSTGLSGIAYYFANEAFRDYQTAPPEEIADKEKKVKLWDTVTIAALGTGGVSLLISSIFWISRPPIKQATEELESVQREIDILENELR